MTRSMTRVALTGCMALAAFGAAAVIDVGTATAEAAPSVSPFAGTYVGDDPRSLVWTPFTVTISDRGQVTTARSYFNRDKISGGVDAGGSYAVSVVVTLADSEETNLHTIKYSSYGTMALDGSGNIVGTTSTGSSFLWVRQ